MKTLTFVFYTIVVFLISNFNVSFWVIPSLGILTGYITYRTNFKSRNMFKFFIFRSYIKIRQNLNRLNNSINRQEVKNEILPIQSKSVRLWKLLLRDSDSVISCSMVNKIRQIEKDNMLLILSPINEMDYQMTIMDVDNNKSCLFEISIGGKYSESIIDLFDDENERRMKLGQLEKRESIHNDLDKLLSQQEQTLKKNNHSKG